MNELKACLKKELLEAVRRKRLIIFTAIAVGLVPLVIVMLYALQAILTMLEGAGAQADMRTLSTATMFYSSFMQAYYTLPVIILVAGTVAGEIKKGKWVLPVCSGVQPRNMVAAKLLVLAACTVLPVVVGYLLNTMLGVLLFEQDTEVGYVLLGGLGLVVHVLFFTTVTVALSALTKRQLVAAAVPIVFLVIGQTFFDALGWANYTPFLFSELVNLSAPDLFGVGAVPMPTAAEWVTGSLVTFGVLAGLSGWALTDRRLAIA